MRVTWTPSGLIAWQIERRRLALGGRVGGEDDLPHRPVAQAAEQLG